MLSIGSGDGVVEIARMQRRGLRFGLIEPSQRFFDHCLADAREAGLEARLLEVHNQAFQDYHSAERSNIVLSLFSWFALSLDRTMLEKASLRETGRQALHLSPGGILSVHHHFSRQPF